MNASVEEQLKENELNLNLLSRLSEKIYNVEQLEKLQNNLKIYNASSDWCEPPFIVFLFNLNLMMFNFLNKIVSFYRKIILSNRVFRKLFSVKPRFVSINGIKIKAYSATSFSSPVPLRFNSPRERAFHMNGKELYY